jgi:hypothetical protein
VSEHRGKEARARVFLVLGLRVSETLLDRIF